METPFQIVVPSLLIVDWMYFFKPGTWFSSMTVLLQSSPRTGRYVGFAWWEDWVPVLFWPKCCQEIGSYRICPNLNKILNFSFPVVLKIYCSTDVFSIYLPLNLYLLVELLSFCIYSDSHSTFSLSVEVGVPWGLLFSAFIRVISIVKDKDFSLLIFTQLLSIFICFSIRQLLEVCVCERSRQFIEICL